jgi:hypothetical protein
MTGSPGSVTPSAVVAGMRTLAVALGGNGHGDFQDAMWDLSSRLQPFCSRFPVPGK